MKFEIQYKVLNQVINNVDCDVEYIMNVFRKQYEGLAVILSLKCGSKQLDVEDITNNLVF